MGTLIRASMSLPLLVALAQGGPAPYRRALEPRSAFTETDERHLRRPAEKARHSHFR